VPELAGGGSGQGAWEQTAVVLAVLTEGGQGRPEAARRGSLDGPGWWWPGSLVRPSPVGLAWVRLP
jgi:hypothetical protein